MHDQDVVEHVEEGKRNVHSLNNSYTKPRTIYITPYDMAYALFLGAIAGLCIGALLTF